MHLGKYISNVMEQQGRNKNWVAEKTDIKYKTFVDKLNRDTISGKELLRIAAVLNISLEDLKEIENREEVCNMYKITICNLGYENENLQKLDNRTGDLKTLLKAIKRIKAENGKKIEGYKITNINYEVTEADFIKDNDYAMNIIETEDSDRCIYISKVTE